MPWKETTPVEERVRFVLEVLDKDSSIEALCRQYGISGKTGHKWLNRYRLEGLDGLKERSRASKHHPNAVPARLGQRIVEFKLRYPTWGPRKIISRLEKLFPLEVWPANSTAGELLRRHGLVKERKRVKKTPPSFFPLEPAHGSNDVWGADFKGWFRAQDGQRIDPLTITDLASRFLIRCSVVDRPNYSYTRATFESAFRELGLPKAIRTDNGVPFASTSVGGLSRLSVWWIRLGIDVQRSRPGQPQDNGCHERMHLTLKEDTTSPPEANRQGQQRAFDRFRDIFNNERPHEAIGMATPAERYAASPRPYPERLPELTYGPDHELRRVRSNGEIKIGGKPMFLSESLISEHVGILEVDDGVWRIDFGPLELGQYNVRERKLRILPVPKARMKLLPMRPV